MTDYPANITYPPIENTHAGETLLPQITGERYEPNTTTKGLQPGFDYPGVSLMSMIGDDND